MENKNGTYLVSYNTAPYERRNNSKYVELEVTMSTENTYIERSYGKIDDRLSYIGGLFEISIIFLSFFLTSYNVYRYEIMISEKAYTSPEKKVNEGDFNFILYIKYTIYSWINILLCSCKLKWKDCEKIDEART